MSEVADYTRSQQVNTRTTYRLPNPTNWAEVYKVFSSIQQEFPHAESDDAVFIHGDDEDILIVVDETGWKDFSTKKDPVLDDVHGMARQIEQLIRPGEATSNFGNVRVILQRIIDRTEQ